MGGRAAGRGGRAVRRAVGGAMCAALAAAGLLAAGAAPATAATMSISGTVTFEPGADLSNLGGIDAIAEGLGYTGVEVDLATGRYTISGLDPGYYKVAFWPRPLDPDNWTDPGLVPVYYPHVYYEYDAHWIDLNTSNATGVDATLEWSRTISGQVTLPDGVPAEAFGGIDLRARPSDFSPPDYFGDVDATGGFEVTGLPAGDFILDFQPFAWWDEATQQYQEEHLLWEYHPGTADESLMTVFDTSAGDIDGVVMPIRRGREISGTLTVEPGARQADLAGVRPVARAESAGQLQYGDVDPETGEYTIPGLRWDRFTVCFEAEDYYVPVAGSYDEFVETALLSECWDDRLTREEARWIDVRAADATGIDAELADSHSISGTVSLPAGADPELLWAVDVYVELDGAPDAWGSAQVDPDTGRYTVTDLRDGDHLVEFSVIQWWDDATGTIGTPDLAAEWFDGAHTRRAATLVHVDDADVTGIDASLTRRVHFRDVHEDEDDPYFSWFFSSISWLADAGVTTGWSVGGGQREFRPFANITRDAMAAFLYRYAGSPAYPAPAVSPFVDVAPGQPFYKEICWLAAQGITTGWSVGGGKKEFRPYAPIARDAMAAFLYRFADEPAFAPPRASPFVDTAPGMPFYKEIAWLADAEISTGWVESGGKRAFRPYASITRDAMAAFLDRFDALRL